MKLLHVAFGAFLIASLVASLPAQTRPTSQELKQELAQARANWAAKKPANYEFVLNVPRNESWWEREFGIFRVSGKSSTAIMPLTGPPAAVFKDRTTIDALFDLVADRIGASPEATSPHYDDERGYVASLFSPEYSEVSFDVPVWRSFNQLADVREPFALIVHVNHCGAFLERTDTRQCPTYAIAIWGDGTAVYHGSSGVRTLGRRQHQVGQDAMRDLLQAIADSGFFSSAGLEYHSVAAGPDKVTTVSHSAEKWITIRAHGQYKTVHDFYGAPDSIKKLEAAIERSADSRRYTGRADGYDARIRK